MIDLHAHSTASDGSLSPGQLISLAANEGLSAIALTDHDTVAGLDEAADAAERASIRFVPGIELEVAWPNGVFHLLGLGLRRWHGKLRESLEQVRRFRKERNLRMVERLRSAGIPITYEELTEVSGHDTVGRPHFAQWLLRHGTVSSMQEAFDTMIGNGGPFYERKEGLSVGKTCKAVHDAGGVAVVAHPQTLRMSWGDLAKSLKRWRGEGLDGVEAYHANLTCNDAHRIAALANELGMIVTAGSDFHGPPRTDRRLGRTCDGRPIDDRFLDAIGVYDHGAR
jgi:hypothetical protein